MSTLAGLVVAELGPRAGSLAPWKTVYSAQTETEGSRGSEDPPQPLTPSATPDPSGVLLHLDRLGEKHPQPETHLQPWKA